MGNWGTPYYWGSHRIWIAYTRVSDFWWYVQGQSLSEIGEEIREHRRNIGEASEEYSKLNETQKKILELLSQNSQLSALKMSQEIGISSRNVESNIQILKKEGFLIRHGSPKNGYWEIVEWNDHISGSNNEFRYNISELNRLFMLHFRSIAARWISSVTPVIQSRITKRRPAMRNSRIARI